MILKDSTLNFVNDFVLPEINEENINSNNIHSIISYIEDEFEKPLSIKLANDEDIDFDFFTLVNSVISDLCLNK